MITFPKGLTAELAAKAKELFPGAADVHKAIDEALASSSPVPEDDQQELDDSGENQE